MGLIDAGVNKEGNQFAMVTTQLPICSTTDMAVLTDFSSAFSINR